MNRTMQVAWVSEGTFSALADCQSCSRAAALGGSAWAEEYLDDDRSVDYYVCRVENFLPSPHLFSIPKGTPDTVRVELVRAFRLYWVDVASAGNALRVGLERLMDEHGVPRSRRSKKGTKTRIERRNLHDRIQWFGTNRNVDVAAVLTATKWITNSPSHGGDFTEADFGAALQLMEHVLQELYEQRTKLRERLVRRVNKTKRPPSRLRKTT